MQGWLIARVWIHIVVPSICKENDKTQKVLIQQIKPSALVIKQEILQQLFTLFIKQPM